MKFGCGIRVRQVGNAHYMLLWWYERENGRSVKREKYLGRVDDPEARAEGLNDLRGYLLARRDELDRRIAEVTVSLGTPVEA
jgi:hypothetical protein